MLIQKKNFSFKFDEVTDEGKIKGYASTFDNVDFGNDVVEKGAFKKSINETGGRWPILANHRSDQQIGWNFKAEEDERGLFVEGEIDLNVQLGREKWSLAKNALKIGAPMGLSIGYMPIKAEPDRKNPMIRRLKELKMYEYSIVTFPMNDQAMITGAKGLEGIDRTNYTIEQLNELKRQGLSLEEIKHALLMMEAATKKDPTPIVSQSIDDLIKIYKS